MIGESVRAQYAVYKTHKPDGSNWEVKQVTETMPRRQAQTEAKRLQAEITEPGQFVHTAPAQFYAVNTISGKVLI